MKVAVIHEIGVPGGAQRWRAALERAEGIELFAPDLPGHGVTPTWPGGAYELGDAAVHLAPRLASEPPACVIGVGTSGWSATVVGLGGLTSSVVLVDGLGGPFEPVQERVRRSIAWRRAIADDAAATAAPAAAGLDPRAALGVCPLGNMDVAREAARSSTVPTLVIETPDTSTDASHLAELVASYPDASFLRSGSREPEDLAPLIASWLDLVITARQ